MVRRSKRRTEQDRAVGNESPTAAVVGGRYRPLPPEDAEAIRRSAFEILERIGMSGAPEWLADRLVETGAQRRGDGRITFSKGMVDAAIQRAPSVVEIPGYTESDGIVVGGGRVHIGTGGAAVQVLDGGTGMHRDSTLDDLYGLMRVLDHCDRIHYGVRPVVARDMPTPLTLDINTAFACLKATGKPIGVSFENASHVGAVVDLFDTALRRENGYRSQPFCMAIVVHAVSPLRFSPEGVETIRSAIRNGMPLQICSAGQAGATSPASLAGALAQGLAESLAGLMAVDAINPGHPCILAFMPFVSDLRTGAMTGGSGECALANAAAAQLLLEMGLPSTVSAGMTDSKIGDAQAGYEKGYSVALAAQAGADMVNLSVGMLGSIMVASPEIMVIDNEMCGAVLRTVRGVDASPEMIDIDSIERVVTGDGHYLGEQQTLDLMRSEYVYPDIGDRRSVADWTEAGRPSIWDHARRRVEEIRQIPATHLPREAERAIRDRFDIRLGEEVQTT